MVISILQMVLIFGRENVKSAKGVKHKKKNFWWLTSMLCVIIPSSTYYIGNLEFAKLVPGEAHFYDLNGDEIEKETTEIKWNAEAAEKAGFEHFMMKEIYEQPKAIRDALN